MVKKVWVWILLCIMLFPTGALAKNDSKDTLAIDPDRVTMFIGDVKDLEVEWVSGKKSAQNVADKASYKLSRSGIVSVDNKGKIKGLQEGKATITATYNGLSASASIEVKTPVLKEISINSKLLSLSEKETFQLQVTGTYDNGGKADITAQSTFILINQQAASITSKGLITALKPGIALLTVIVDKKIALLPITVAPAKVSLTAISAEPQEVNVDIGSSAPVRAKAYYSDGSAKDISTAVKAKLADESIAEYSNSVVTGKSEGNTVLNLEYEKKTISVPVAVSDPANLIKNGGFEALDRSSGQLLQWTRYVDTAGGSAESDATHAFSGSKSIRMSAANMNSGASVMIYQVIPVQEGRPFMYKGMLKAESLNQANVELYIDYYDSQFNWVANKVVPYSQSGGGYTQVQSEGIIPQHASYANVFVTLRSAANGASGTIYADQFSFKYQSVKEIQAEPSSIDTEVNLQQPISIQAKLDSGSLQDVTPYAAFATSNEQVAKIEGGSIVAASPGQAVVTASYEGKTVQIPVNVAEKSYIANGSFETSLEGSWNQIEGANTSTEIAEGHAYNGTKALMIKGTGMQAGSSSMIYQVIPVQGGKAFKFSGYTDSALLNQSNVELYVDFYDASFQWISNHVATRSDASAGYTPLVNQGVVPVNAAYANIFVILRANQDGASSTVYVDALKWQYPQIQSIKVAADSLEVSQGGQTRIAVEAYLQDGSHVDISDIASYTSREPAIFAVNGSAITGVAEGSSILDIQFGDMHAQLPVKVTAPEWLNNARFENGTDTNPLAGWTPYLDHSDGSASVTAERKYEGGHALQLQAGQLNYGNMVSVYQVIPVQANKDFQLSGYVDIPSLNQAAVQLYVDFYTKDFVWLGNQVKELTQVTEGFRELSSSGKVPTGAAYANVFVVLRGTGVGGSGLVYADALKWDYPKLSGLQLSAETLDLQQDQSQQISVYAQYSNGTTRDVTLEAAYSSANPDVAAVQAGNVSAHGGGATAVTVSYQGLTAQLNVYVQGRSLLVNGGFEQYTNGSGTADYWQTYVDASSGMGVQIESVTAQSAPVFVGGDSVTSSVYGSASVTDSVYGSVTDSVYGGSSIASPVYVNVPQAAYVFEGERAQKISASNMQSGRSVMLYQVIPVREQQAFDFSGHVFMDAMNKANAELYIDFYDTNFNWVGNSIVSVPGEQSTSYKDVYSKGTVPARGAYANVFIVLRAAEDGASGTLFLDGFQFTIH